jgi:hypothetical protein
VDVAEELLRFGLLLRPHSASLVDRCTSAVCTTCQPPALLQMRIDVLGGSSQRCKHMQFEEVRFYVYNSLLALQILRA